MVCLIASGGAAASRAAEVRVSDTNGLREALAAATPGTSILLAPGTYEGGVVARELHGSADQPIVIRAADPARRPVFSGGASGLQLSSISHLELGDLIIQGAGSNGINIDDGGRRDRPSHHVVLKNLTIRDVGPDGNRDGLKCSGLDDFQIVDCTIERWGARGSGIDMVGCHRGEVIGCTFRHAPGKGDNGVQTKGGSREIVIRRCRFENAGGRGVNIGGSTGLEYFRPAVEGFEAKDITVEDCTFFGSDAAIAFVGIDGAVARHNTIYRPRRWVFRILQENRAEGFVPSRSGQFTDNLIVFRADELSTPLNIGGGTAAETFTVARNAWHCLDAPDRSQVRLPITEADGVYMKALMFLDAEHGDLRQRPDSELTRFGVREPGS